MDVLDDGEQSLPMTDLATKGAGRLMSSSTHALGIPTTLPVISALVVDPDVGDAITIASTLAACRLHVTVAESFASSKERLAAIAPHVLVTAVRLAEYNGLHVVLRAKALRQDCAAIVTSTTLDPVLRADSEAMGATFVLKPIVRNELATAVFRTLFRQRDGLDQGPLRPPF
jgi:DNA-binding NtrC family response regulator